MKRLLLLCAVALASCGESPAPPVARPDAGPSGRCTTEICLPGESCDERLGCFCAEGSCPAPAICGASGRCENLCAAAACAAGETCVPESGACECGRGDPCPADRFCNEPTRRCETRCTGTGCGRGERCEPSTGACVCADCAAEKLACDPTTRRCVDRCPVCPAGETCDDPVVGECRCTDTSCAAHQICDASRRCVDLCQGKACNPGEACDPKSGACACDQCGPRDRCNDAKRCEPKCTGVTCPPGEACQDTTGVCHCGISPNTCVSGKKCDPATLACVDMCLGVSCPAGEGCNPTSGACECVAAPSDSCSGADPTRRCDPAAKKCVAQCLGVACAPGEACNPSSGGCQCQTTPADTCAAAAPSIRCNASTRHCEEKCRNVSCPAGEACVATSGDCHCGIPNTCPAGKKCDTASLQCVGLCSGVACAVRGESCDAATGACTCALSPDSCAAVDAASKCDPGSRKCVSQCAGLSCAPGESCSVGSGKCECGPGPEDSCTAALATQRCNAATLKCESKCAGVACAAGETCLEATGACACGPATCPAGQKCDTATLHCVGLCAGVTCAVRGEDCDPATGACACAAAPDSCSASDATTRCDAARRCVSKCQGVFCGAGEACGPTTGTCACTASPDSCSAADATRRCGAGSRCVAKCAGVVCAAGMACVAETGECRCALPNSCPAGQRCDSASLVCVPACQGVTCATPGESCEAATGQCRCQASPADTCTAANASTKCDAGTSRCVSRCAGVSCAPGEACDSGTATCRCATSPDSCSAVDAAQRCDGASLRCVLLCSGVSCAAGETCNPANGACECTADSCLANFRCNASRHCEACAQETDAQFCARQSRECGAASGTDNCGRSRTASCGSCPSPTACTGGLCLLPNGPTNDNCIGAQALTFDASGHARVTGDTTNATDGAHAAVCGVGYGNDVVYSFTTTAVKNVDVSLAFAGTLWPVLYVRKACASASSTDEVACADAAAPGSPAALGLLDLPAGTYSLFVDAYGGEAGAFTLDVQLSDPPPVPANDTCAAPTVLTVANDAAGATGDSRGARHDSTGTCAAADGADVVYAIDLAAARSLTATVARDSSTPAYRPAVYVRKACASGAAADEAACASESGGVATATAASVGPGRVYVVVDGVAGTAGKYALQIALGAPIAVPGNEACASAAPLTFVAGRASASASTTYARNDLAGGCGGTGPELVWTFTTSTIATITAKATPTAGSTGYRPVVYLRATACEGASSTEPACKVAAAGGQAATATSVNAPAGTYWVVVDGYAGTKGDFTLELSIVPPNDLCSGAQAIAPSTTYPGNTFNAAFHYGSSLSGAFSAACRANNYGTKGPDVVYAYTPATSGSVTVTVVPGAGTYDPLVWVMDAPCGNWYDFCLGFSDAGGGGTPETVTFAAAGGVTYYFVVGSFYSTGSGAFTIAVTGP